MNIKSWPGLTIPNIISRFFFGGYVLITDWTQICNSIAHEKRFVSTQKTAFLTHV